LDKQSVPITVGLLSVICKSNATYLDAISPTIPSAYPQLLKVVSRLAKDHVGKSDAKAQAAAAAARTGRPVDALATSPEEKAKNALVTETLVKGLKLLREKTKDLSTEGKKMYYLTISTLLDKSTVLIFTFRTSPHTLICYR
jgi:hypothetical protein